MTGIPGRGKTGGYSALKSKYRDFSYPQAEILVDGKLLTDRENQTVITDVNVELTSGFEASMARFRIYNLFDMGTGQFQYQELVKRVVLGASLTVRMGYLDCLETVFVGFIAEVSFDFDPNDLPYMEVTGMDVKGIMMANCYAMQLTSHSYGEAVSEIFKRTAYEKLRNADAVAGIQVTDTPDRKTGSDQKASAETMEMVCESDYEFVVKAAKKFNYEFFVENGTVIFRKAKANKTPLMELGMGAGLVSFHIGYSITGLAETVIARSMNPGTGKVISSKKKLANALSTGSKAKGLISKSTRVFIDPTIFSQSQADARAASLMEEMSYRLGSLECECVGLPELMPGYFITIQGLGAPVDNNFYITSVIHDFQEDTGYRTRLIGKAAEVKSN